MARQQQENPKFRYVSRPQISETFADSIETVLFDGNTIRVELCVTRLDQPKPPQKPTGDRVTAARLVLTPHCAEELLNRLNRLVAGLAQVRAQQEKNGQPTAAH